MQERQLCWPPYFFPWPYSGPPVAPKFFHSRIATDCERAMPLKKRMHAIQLAIVQKQCATFPILHLLPHLIVYVIVMYVYVGT